MALAKPVIASLVGGLGEMIRHGEDGFLYTQANRQAYRDSILTLSVNNDLAEKMRQNAHKKIAANFSHEQMIDSFIAIYTSLRQPL